MGLWRLRGAIEELKNAIEAHRQTESSEGQLGRNPLPTNQTVTTVVSFNDKTIRDTQTENDRQYGVQNSIRRAAWFAFVAAATYAGIAAYQSYLTRRQIHDNAESFRLDERAWVEIDPIKPTFLAPADSTFPTIFTCDIYPRNVGKTVARNIVVKAQSSVPGRNLGTALSKCE